MTLKTVRYPFSLLVTGLAAGPLLVACEAVLGTGSLTERSGLDAGDDSSVRDSGHHTDASKEAGSGKHQDAAPDGTGPGSGTGRDAAEDVEVESAVDAAQDAPHDAPREVASMTCPDGGTACGTTCIDVTSDSNNCGRCGRVCGEMSTCSMGTCTPAVVCSVTDLNSQADEYPMLIIGTTAFWGLGQTIHTCDLTQLGSPPGKAFSTALLNISAIGFASDGQHLWYATRNTTSTPPHCFENEYDLGMQMTTGDFDFSSTGYVETTIDPSSGLFFFAYGTEVDELAPVLPEPMAGEQPRSCLELDNGGTLPAYGPIASAGGHLIAADTANALIVGSIPGSPVCTSPKTLVQGRATVDSLATDGNIFAFNDGTNVVACNASLGCSPVANPPALVATQGEVDAIVIDGASPPNLYWVGSSGLVTCSSQATKCNGTPAVMDPGATLTSAVALDETYVYYVQGNTLYRIAR